MPKKAAPKTDQETTPVTPEQMQHAVAQSASEYFTADRNESIQNLSDSDMWQLLRELEQTHYWTAILKYTGKRLLFSQTIVNSADPVKEPTNIARAQGIMQGMTDLQNLVIQLITMEQTAKEEADKISRAAGA